MPTPVITKQAAEALQLGKNGSYSNEGNVLDHTLFDSEPFQATTVRATTSFFTAPQNSPNAAGNNKTSIETNMSDPGKLPNGQTFLIQKMSLAIKFGMVGTETDANTILAAYYNIIQNSVFEIKLAGREYDMQKPGTEFVSPQALAGLASAANGAFPQGTIISTGAVQLKATPIPIGQLVSFSVIQRTGNANATLLAKVNTASDVLTTQLAELQVRLHGVLTRAI